MCKGEMVTKPTPTTKTDIECGTAVRTVGKEVGWLRKNGLSGGMGK